MYSVCIQIVTIVARLLFDTDYLLKSDKMQTFNFNINSK